MSRENQLAELIATATGLPQADVVSLRSCSGGCIHRAEVAELADGRFYFVKASRMAREVFEREAEGLQATAKAGTLRIPEVVGLGQLEMEDCLVLKCIQSQQPERDFFTRFGTCLAELHRSQKSDRFGWQSTNYLGSSIQLNTWSDHWSHFFSEQRLQPQVRRAEESGLASAELRRLANRLLDRVPMLLDGADSPPVLLHGDLWSGNFMADERGRPVIFDPAVYFGDREAELAMPLLFGGFSPSFYEAYDETWPLAEGWQDRVELYKLYHLLNHLNLFGSSYLGSCLDILRRLA